MIHSIFSEELSAKFCMACCHWLSDNEKKRIYDLIYITRHRDDGGKANLNIDQQIMLDIDLAALADNNAKFIKDGNNIRKEYSWVPEMKIIVIKHYSGTSLFKELRDFECFRNMWSVLYRAIKMGHGIK